MGRKRRARKKNDAGLSKKALWKEIRKEERKKARAHMSDLVSAKKGAREARTLARAEMRAGCKLAREAAKRRARSTCEKLEDRYIDAGVRFQGARAALLAERKYRREMRAIEASGKSRSKEERAKRAKAHERRSESDDEVRGNIPAELRPLFEKVKRGIKGSSRKSRTEEFLEYVEAHPREAWESDDYEERAAREMEERAARANPKKRKRKRKRNPPDPRTVARAKKTFRETHWGRVGKNQVRRVTAVTGGGAPSPKGVLAELGMLVELRWRHAQTGRVLTLRFDKHRVRAPRLAENARHRLVIADVDRSSYVLPWPHSPRARRLGELLSITYRTRKGTGVFADAKIGADYVHAFEKTRPDLVVVGGGLAIVGGDYTVSARGIVG